MPVISTNLGLNGTMLYNEVELSIDALDLEHQQSSVYMHPRKIPPSKENLMAMELCKDGLKNISGEVDYTIYHSLTH
jgi:hypothetical protein